MATTYYSQGEKDGTGAVFTVTNFVADFDMDANTVTLGVVADTLGTLIRDLQRQGILKGTCVTA